ncbi:MULTISPECIES: class I SAM-dependent methyltransferase [Methanobacterium]|uniref:Class I SAM-dependent methyltransferase n=1 Tax=Methanobacterium veterum TaxID=408577 RepID=A0A9E4ZXA4_9EURY|nr:MULTISPECIES: class I SAM-dependent methyltransferase [Methanobacterium]MCZ3365318.1 class I SAM-dependent methyltransferase [Methanobacterium veterum]MCZ3373069.1 class I SAM-dependent methyltransferase [Methanobacterium veterum]
MWKEIQKHETNHSQNEGVIEARWNRTAAQFKRWMEVDDYPLKLMQRVKLKPEWSLLDIGCGAGAVSIPAAKKAARVTALDISGEMLKILREDAQKEHISNITYMHRSWTDIVVGDDIEPHDVVVASRSVGREPDIQSAIEKIDSAASRYVYITVWGGGEHSHCKGVPAVLGRPYRNTPDHVYFYNILQQMGIRANVEHLECHSRLIYSDLDEAMESCRISLGPLSEKEEKKARAYLDKTLIRLENGMLEVPDSNRCGR